MKTSNTVTLTRGTFEFFIANQILTLDKVVNETTSRFTDCGNVKLWDKYRVEVQNNVAKSIFEYQLQNIEIISDEYRQKIVAAA